jgi:DNA topoisomerase I
LVCWHYPEHWEFIHDQGKEGKDYRSLKAADNVLTISLERALELLSEPKKGRSSTNSKSKAALRELGTHPEDGEAINIYDGPYGPYIKHGKTNVSIPEGQSVENITLAEALNLLTAKASTGKSTRKTSKSTSPKSKSTTKSTTKSSTTAAKKKGTEG